MSHPLHHSMSSAKKHGGHFEDYLPIHSWFDESKSSFPDMRHRAMRHHSEGIFWCEQIFGTYITNSDGKMVPVRVIGEQHCMEDLGWIPTMRDYLECMSKENWIFKSADARKIARQVSDEGLDKVKPETATL
jgi:hypothetical protein